MAKRSRTVGRKKGAAKKSKPRLTRTPTPAGAIPVVCSECYSDFLYVTSSDSKSVSCPACGHGGSVPESAEIQRLELAKASEKKAFMTAVVPGLLFLLFGLFYFMQLNSAGSTDALGPAMNYGLIGVTVLLFLITIIFAARYEKTRCEVYF
ncbi:MAG: hypothetical protein HRU16_10225 [Planctomycetes bacterium]|nr:hypothetical protein [Planctomycetota bacterium]